MKRKILVTIVTSISLAVSFAYSQPKTGTEKVDTTTILVVNEVVVTIGNSSFDVIALKMTDEKENQVIFSKNGRFGNATVQRGFENATVQNMKMPKNTPIGFAENGSLIIGNDAKLLFEFKVNNKVYSIGVGTGTKFVVEKTETGNYILLPEETAKLSPPPEI